MRLRSRDERGVALPSPVAALSLGAVLLAGVAFITTSGGTEEPAEAAPAVPASASPTPAKTAPEPVIEEKKKPAKKKEEPAVRRGDVYVEVYNNSGISGLAFSTALMLCILVHKSHRCHLT